MVVGDPGLGKSQLTAYIASIVTQAGIWPDKTVCEQSGEVIILSAEDDPACTIVPRLIAAGANLSKVNIIEAVKAGCDYRGNPVLKQFDFITDIEEFDKY
jgi:putative DNA primase/helicase